MKSIRIPSVEDAVLGQYTNSIDGSHCAYTQEKGVPIDSKTETFAAIRLFIDNERWANVPFILKAGKGLNQSKVEIRIQFKEASGSKFTNADRNELVIRIQPKEAIYLKLNAKTPGISNDLMITELDLSYSQRYKEIYIPEAYENLLADIVRNDHSNFVRRDELLISWKIFDKLFNQLSNTHPSIYFYPFGSRGPAEADIFIRNNGFVRTQRPYMW